MQLNISPFKHCRFVAPADLEQQDLDVVPLVEDDEEDLIPLGHLIERY